MSKKCKRDFKVRQTVYLVDYWGTDNIPFIVIRGISDSPNGNNNVTFEEYLEKAAQRCAELIEIFMKN